MGRCEDEKMIYRPPLLEEPFAQTFSGINYGKTHNYEKQIIMEKKTVNLLQSPDFAGRNNHEIS